MTPWTISRRLPVLCALLLTGAAMASAKPSTGSRPQLTGRWEMVSVDWDDAHRKAMGHSRLVIRNAGKVPLAKGWTLWFNSIGDNAGADRDLPVHRIVGSLFAVDPAGGLPALQPGQSLTIPLDHPGSIPRDDKAPSMPYVVPSDDPGHPFVLKYYQKQGLRRETPGAPATLFTDPAVTFATNPDWSAISGASIAPVLPEPRSWRRGATRWLVKGLGRPSFGPGLRVQAAFASRLPGAGRGRLPFRVEIDSRLMAVSSEAYELTIDQGTGIRLKGATPAGVFYGLQSLDQILFTASQSDGSLLLPTLEIRDAPRFAYRGLLIDVARNFRTPAEMRRVIDLMARFKLNRLHLHLSDDEGWRLAIPALPELTRIGARRGHAVGMSDRLPPAFGSGPDVGKAPGSGFYSGAEYVALLRYAHARAITVVPEIDTPGHSRAAIVSMKARAAARPDEHGRYLLSDPGDRSVYQSPQGFSDNALDPGLGSADAFVETVLTELVRLHRAAGVPLKVMHIGADEVPAGAWQHSPAAQARLASIGDANGGHAALWNDWFDRVDAMLRRHGIDAMGWEELGLTAGGGGIAVNPHFAGRGMTVEVWNDLPGSEGLGNLLANAGYRVVLAPARSLYFDMAQAPDPSEPGHDWANILPLSGVFAFDPLTREPGVPMLTDKGRANIAGIEGALFSETVTSTARLDHMLMPRLLALAERAWAPSPAWAGMTDGPAAAARKTDFARFSKLLGDSILPYVESRFPNLAYSMPAPGVRIDGSALQANYAWPGVTLRYVHGTANPRPDSPVLTGTIPADGPVTIAAFTRAGRMSAPVTIGPLP